MDIFRLRDAINKRIYPQFNPAQESIVPIINRPDLKMHIRHKSIPALLLNRPLIAETSEYCTFCHCRIAARSIHKHYHCRHDLVPLASHFREHIYSMANSGSGRGRCNFCDRECRDVRSPECGVLFQIAVMIGPFFQPKHFPYMPVMMKASRSILLPADSAQHCTIPAPDVCHA